MRIHTKRTKPKLCPCSQILRLPVFRADNNFVSVALFNKGDEHDPDYVDDVGGPVMAVGAQPC